MIMRSFIALLLVTILPAMAQNAAPGSLKIVVVEGESAFNNIHSKTGRNLTVEIRDERNQPVPGAQVVFQLPPGGPGGTYIDAQTMFTTTTDSAGRAHTVGFRPNSTEGRFEIRINASKDGRTGSTVTSQSNTLAGGPANTQNPGPSHKKKWILVLAIGGAAAAAGVIVATHGSSGGTAATPPGATISIGTISVGAPR
jgi:hypothetical protein